MRNTSIVLMLLLAACTYPQAIVSTVEASPSLKVTGASQTAELFVDGQPAGLARTFGEGGHVLSVPHGTHHVEIRDGGMLAYGSDVYFGTDSTKTISLAAGIK
jgi:hypothetical protein